MKKHIPGTEKTGLQAEYQRLVYVAKEDVSGKFVEATKEYNHSKNRYHNILPYEKNRVKLTHQVGLFARAEVCLFARAIGTSSYVFVEHRFLVDVHRNKRMG